MPPTQKVSLTTQTIFCLIPVLDMYAAYRVKKLRMYLAIIILLIGVPTSVASGILFPSDEDSVEGFVNMLTYYYGVDDYHFAFSVAVHAVTVLVAVFLVRRWSRQWNMQFD